MKKLILWAALMAPALAFAADRCVTDIGTRTTGSCAATCDATDFATAGTCYNSAAQGSSSVTTALTQSTADGDTITIDDGIHSISTNILTSSMTGPVGTVTIRCRTATRGSCGFTQSSATAANFSMGNATIATNFVFQNLACTKSVAHTSTTTTACFHNSGAATGNVTLDSVYAYGITYNVGTSTTGAILSNATSSSNKTTTIQGTTLVENITVNGTAAVPGVIGIYSGTNDLVVTGLTARNITATDAASMFSCADDCDLSAVRFESLAITDTDAQWHGVIDATDTSLSAAISDVFVRDSTFNISSSTSIGAILGKFQGPATIASSGCTGNTVALISGSVTTPIGPCWIAAGANGAVVTTDGTVTGNTAPIGLCGYANQGGSLTQSRLTCTGNTIGQGLIYCGGWGSCNLYSSILAGNTQNSSGEGSEGGVFLCQLQSTATSARTCAIYNSVLVDNTPLAAATGSVYFRNNDADGCTGAPCVHTMLITNSVIRNGKAQEIVSHVTDAAATDVLTIKTSNLTDKDDPTPATAGSGAVTETLTSNIETDPGFVCGHQYGAATAACFKTLSSSGLRGTGTVLAAPLFDFQNRRFETPRDIGAYQFGGGDEAAARTAR